MNEVRELIGIPYQHLDCGELATKALSALGRENPTPEYIMEAASQAFADHERPEGLHEFIDSHMEIVPLGSEEPGDIVFIRRGPMAEVNHVGVVVGRGRMLHTTRVNGSHVASLDRYRDTIDCIGRTRRC